MMMDIVLKMIRNDLFLSTYKRNNIKVINKIIFNLIN